MMDRAEDIYKAIKNLSNRERIKLLDMMFYEYYDSRPSKEVMERELDEEIWGIEEDDEKEDSKKDMKKIKQALRISLLKEDDEDDE